jgi:chromate transport protein ChrA
VPLVEAIFFGVKAAVLAVVVEAVLRIGRRALKTNAMVALAAVAFVAIYVFQVPFPVIVLGAVLSAGSAVARRRISLLPGDMEAPRELQSMSSVLWTRCSSGASSATPCPPVGTRSVCSPSGSLSGLAQWRSCGS